MIILKNVILRRSAKVLLDGASVTLNPGEKVIVNGLQKAMPGQPVRIAPARAAGTPPSAQRPAAQN